MPSKKKLQDKVIQRVCDEFQKRSEIGLKKYGVSLDQNHVDDFLQHAIEEAMDLVNYSMKIKMDREKKCTCSLLNEMGIPYSAINCKCNKNPKNKSQE